MSDPENIFQAFENFNPDGNLEETEKMFNPGFVVWLKNNNPLLSDDILGFWED